MDISETVEVKGHEKCIFMPAIIMVAIYHPEGLASGKSSSRKLPFSCVKSVSEHIRSLSGVKNTTKKSRKADWKVGGGDGSMLTLSLSVKYSFFL